MLALNLFLESLQALIDIYFFSTLLYRLSPLLSKLVVACAALGTLVTSRLGQDLQRLFQLERRADGDFIYALTRVRENAESIAFYSGQNHEINNLNQLLIHRHETEWARLGRRDLVTLFSEQYRKFIGFIPFYVLFGRVSQDSTMGVIDQAKESFEEILSSLFVVAENYSQISSLATVARELDSYIRRDDLQLQERKTNISTCPIASSEQAWLRTEKLTVFVNDRLLISSLCFEAPRSGGLLITGASGVGKTSLLRALAGLWQSGSGAVYRNTTPGAILFLPQRPYMSLGSLRTQLIYPYGAAFEVDAQAMTEIMHKVDLGHVLKRIDFDFDRICRWDEELSIGEQQRIAVARILVQKPKYAILDEVTSANDPTREAAMYTEIASTCVAFISVGHRPSLERLHHTRLQLLGAGRWQLERV